MGRGYLGLHEYETVIVRSRRGVGDGSGGLSSLSDKDIPAESPCHGASGAKCRQRMELTS